MFHLLPPLSFSPMMHRSGGQKLKLTDEYNAFLQPRLDISMHRNRHYSDLGRDKQPRRGSERHFESREKQDSEDEDDFETYAYEYKSKSYLRTPKPEDSEPKRRAPSSKRYTTDRSERKTARQHSPDKDEIKHYYPQETEHKEHRNYYHDRSERKHERNHRTEMSKNYSMDDIRPSSYSREFSRDSSRKSNQGYSRSGDYHYDKEYLNLAATKIQAAFRGYQTRKTFWRRREQIRAEQNYSHHSQSTQQWQDDYSLSSATSIVENTTVSAIGPTADPNVGLTKKLHSLDSSERNHILRELKTRLSFSDEMPTANQLQTETSPTVMILGGINPENPDDYFTGGSMFLYNVQKDKWLFGGTMPEPRNYHGAVYLNGKVYVIGGYSPLEVNSGQMLSTQTTYQLTVRSKRWRRRADMHQTRACHGTCVIEENIMVMGGRDSTGKLLSTVEVYFPKRDQWSFSKPMPEPIMGMASAVMDGRVWVIGGIISEGGYSSKYSVSNRVYTFDIQQQIWFQKPPLPDARAFASAVSLRREIWLWCGVRDTSGEDGYRVSTNTVFVFNPEMVGWEKKSAISTAKHSTAVTKFGRRVYLLGGVSNMPSGKEVLMENDCYNRENDKYTEGAPLPRPVTGTAAVALPIDYIAASDPKWNLENESDLNQAATKIQAVFRGFRTRSSMAHNEFPHSSGSVKRGFYTTLDHHHEKWKLFQRVQIDDWPPVPDPKNLPSELNLRLGTLPKGYTVSAANTTGKTKVRRYVPLPENVDPNLGICGHICNYYKKTKKLLGLRKVEHLPPFARNMLTVSTLQDDSLPVVLLMGGLEPRDPVNLTNGKLIMRYSPLKDRFEYFGILPEPRNYHAAVYHRNFIYVTGGCDPDKRNCGEMVSTSTTYCLNIHSSEWIQKADMNCTRSHHCVVVFQGKLYAIGGRDHNGRLVASIEAYDIESDTWTLKHPMAHPRMAMACVVYEDQIWCMGGIGISEENNIMTYPVLTSVLSYDVASDAWQSRPPLRCPRAYASSVVVMGSMWLFGGCSKDRSSACLVSMASVDKYYADEAQWTRRTLFNTPRHGAAVVPVESCVYIFGGVSSQEWGAVSKNEMVVINDISLHGCSPLPVPLTGLAAVVVPPVSPSLRAESVALLLHAQLTFH